MSNDTLPTTPEAVAPFLGKVVDRLAAGTITRDDAIALLDAITGDSSDTLWTDADDDQWSRTPESWIRIFDSRLQERNRAANAGASRATNPASGTDGPNVMS